MKTSLSVIIPGYKNPIEWWERCVKSVLNATSENDEIICVDDGTPGGNPELQQLAKLDRRIKVIYRPNGGLSVARNTGWAIAKGEYIAFIDSDDEVYPNIFSECLKKLDETSCDVALYGVRTVWVDEGLTKEDAPPTLLPGELSPHDVKTLSDKCVLNYACNKVYRKSFLDKHQLRFTPKGMPCEDIIFNLECIMAGAEWVMIPQIGYVYYRTGGTLLSQYRKFNSDGLLLGAAAWKQYATTSQEAEELFAHRGEQGETAITWAQWDNLWRLNSPYTFRQKAQWVRENKEDLVKSGGGIKVKLIKLSPLLFTFYQLGYSFLRHYCYIKPVRRWHIKRMYPNAKDVE